MGCLRCRREENDRACLKYIKEPKRMSIIIDRIEEVLDEDSTIGCPRIHVPCLSIFRVTNLLPWWSQWWELSFDFVTQTVSRGPTNLPFRKDQLSLFAHRPESRVGAIFRGHCIRRR
jgi:hypothetical protein